MLSKTIAGQYQYVPISNHSAKIVTLQYREWGAFVSYCGVGDWNGKPTYEYLADWLTHTPGEERSFEDVLKVIQANGSKWLDEIALCKGKWFRHTFIVAGFQKFQSDLARAALVSNYETLNGFLPATASSLEISAITARHRQLLINGIPNAVSKRDREFLKNLMRRPIEPQIVRHNLARVNAAAADSKMSDNGISPACLAFSYLPDGSGYGECHGGVDGPLLPVMILHGANLHALINLNPQPGRKVRFVQFVTANTQSHQAIVAERIDCIPEVCKPETGHPRINDLFLKDLGSINEYCCTLKAITDSGFFVGDIHKPVSAPPHAFRADEQSGQDLGTFGGPVSYGFGINKRGTVVGSAQTGTNASHAFLWTAEKGMVDLGTLGGRDSVARAINNLDWVVGNSFTKPGEPCQDDERAFLWTQKTGMTNLTASSGSWSRAVDINDHGQVIGVYGIGGFMRSYIWTKEAGVQDLGTLGGSFAAAVAINNDGVVVGESEIAPEQRRVFVWTREQGMRDLGLDVGYVAADINNSGEIVGWFQNAHRQRPFLWSKPTGLLFLPWFRDHNTAAVAISNKGDIVGNSSRDNWKHSHPVLWTRAPEAKNTSRSSREPGQTD
jgi:probable HAF family extracellular repeat protein